MTPWFRVALGVVFLLLGNGYLYRPRLIERMNALLRDYFLNDAHIALERRKWGVFFLLMSFLCFYLGRSAFLHKLP